MWDELWQLNLVILTTFKWKQTFWNIILLKSENWNIGCVNKMFTSNAWKKSESWNIENKSFTLNASKKSENWNIEILLKVAWILNIRFWHWMLQTEWTLEYWNKGCVNIENKSLTLNASKKSENWNIEIRLRPCSNFLPCVCLPLLAYRITGQETFRPAGSSRGTKYNIAICTNTLSNLDKNICAIWTNTFWNLDKYNSYNSYKYIFKFGQIHFCNTIKYNLQFEQIHFWNFNKYNWQFHWITGQETSDQQAAAEEQNATLESFENIERCQDEGQCFQSSQVLKLIIEVKKAFGLLIGK